MENLDIIITLQIPFHSYKTKKLNKKAVNSIKKYIRETIENELSYIPLYVEDEIEDSTSRVKIKIRKGIYSSV